MTRQSSLTLTPLLASLIATVALVACNRPEEPRTAGQVVDQTVSKAEKQAKEVGAEVRAGTEKAADAMADAGAKTSNAVRDAAISVEIKAKLAKDPSLSALRIDVDTSEGRVALRGNAPTASARDRATQLAQAVTGVTAVNNELTIVAGS
ncbi:MAG: BON domain-containing protein [Pseudomonadota bacterium]